MKHLKNISKNSLVIFLITAVFSLIPVLAILIKVFSGGVALWNDPARDLISALDNLHKPTLIGPSTGIPGVFYGPYWIWLLSFGQLFSKEPGIITFIVLTLPYLILFPFIISRFSKIFNTETIGLLWLLFLLSYSNYFTDLWNPHPAPLLILLAIYLQFIREEKISLKNLIITWFSGFAVGLVMNFQLSFGIGMMFGSIVYVIGERIIYLVSHKNKIQIIINSLISIVLFVLGICIAFTPFFLFELRHKFQQTKVLLNALTHYGGGLVTQTGLTKQQIIQIFFGKIADLLHMPSFIALAFFIIASIYFIYSYKKNIQKNKTQELKLISIILCICFGVLYIYITAKNPVWTYHFIGVEILFLLLIGILLNQLKYSRSILLIWIAILVANSSITLFANIRNNPQKIYGNAISEEQAVKKIQSESQNQNYTVFAYEAGIYPYEYSYLFQTMYNKDVPYRPELNPSNSKLVFIIIPPNTKLSIKSDFINFRTPPTQYKTTNQWIEIDGTQIIKRILIEK